MGQKIYTLGSDNKLVELEQCPYESEEILQKLLADFPQLLGRTTANEKGVLLIRREMPVPDAQDGADRWSLDHLFVDADGVLILLEVKRASDSRIKREVVGQLLDYAANGTAFWKIPQLIAYFSQTCAQREEDSDQLLEDFFGEGPDTFWKKVEANLRAGRVRLVFLADEIPSELKRVIEFLNEQMTPAEVLGIEVRQFKATDGTRTLVPVLVGDTERALASKSAAPSLGNMSEEEWFTKFGERHGESAVAAAKHLASRIESMGCDRRVTPAGTLVFFQPSSRISMFFITMAGSVQIALWAITKLEGAPREFRQQVAREMKSIPGSKVGAKAEDGSPGIPISALQVEGNAEKFLEVAATVVNQLK